MANLDANMIEHASEMELYMILPTLEKFFFMLEPDSFNHEISADETVAVAQSSPIVHISRLSTMNKYYLIILLSSTVM